MSHWIALLPAPPVAPAPHDDTAESVGEGSCSRLTAEGLAWWALQFTPKVAHLEDAVVLDVHGSERLFGGAEALWARIQTEALAWQVQACRAAPTALGALALARASLQARWAAVQPPEPPWPCALDTLPLSTLKAVDHHGATLARLGCQTLGDVRRLPRGGLSRRFGASLLQALDQAYGSLPLPLEWVRLPEQFDCRLELPGRVDTAPGLVFAVQRLLPDLCAWLAGQQAGLLAFTLRWWHDGRRHDGDTVGQHTIRLASPTRDPQRLLRLTQEHLQRLVLAAPVLDIGLHADECQPLRGDTAALFALDGAAGPHGLSLQADALHTTAAQHAQRDALLSLLDRLSVRLGEQHVQQGGIVADHRLEHAQHWQPAVRCAPTTLSRGASSLSLPGWPQPCWVLPQPLPLALAHEPGGLRERPLYQGPLRLLAGPHRIEAGWWDDQAGHASVARDYYLASSAHAGLLWIYKARPASGPTPHTTGPWFLHGVFA